MPYRPAISVYPPNAPAWAQSGWERGEDNSTEQAPSAPQTPASPQTPVSPHVPASPSTPPPSRQLSTVVSSLPGVQRITHWWATMSTLQLRGFIIAILILTGVSTTSLIANYWILHASGSSLIGLHSSQAGSIPPDGAADSRHPESVRTVTLTSTAPRGCTR